MLEKTIRNQIIDLINKEVVPAVGCTEPMAVALCTARATEILGQKPEKISALLSANILKNAMGVGIPGTGMIGLPIAIALGALIGKSEYQLEVIKDLTPESLEEGKAYIQDSKRINIKRKENISEKLYIEVTCEAGGNKATAIIAGGHTNFVYEEHNGKVLVDKRRPADDAKEEETIRLNMKTVWDFATTTPVEDLAFILKTRDYNIRAARESHKGNYGHNLGKTIERPMSCGIVYLMGGDYTHVCHAINNMVANLTGMICDGAKPSCSIKICSGVSSALLSAVLSIEGQYVTSAEGIIDNDVDRSIRNLTSIGKDAMCPTDEMVLDIMTHKGC